MRKQNQKRDFGAIAFMVCLIALLVCGDEAEAQNVIATNADTPAYSVNKGKLKKLFSGKTKQWGSGVKVVLVLLPKGSPEMKWLAKEIMGMPESVYRRFLLGKVFKGQLKKPIQATSVSDAQRILSSHRGAVAALPNKRPHVNGIKTIFP